MTFLFQAKKELEAEMQANAAANITTVYRGPEEKEFESAAVLAVSGVFFSCELLGEDIVLPRDLMVSTDCLGCCRPDQ